MSVTGLTSNPSIFQKAIAGGHEYDDAIRAHMQAGLKGEELFFELAIEDLRRARDLFAPIHEATNGLDGWCSLEVSPLLANDTHSTIEQAKKLHAKADRKNLYIKVPGTPEGAPAIEELTFAGIPVNVTLIFSVEHYMRAAEAYTHGLERRVDAGLDVSGCSVASLFISRWDVKTSPMLPDELKDTNGSRRRLLQGLRRMARDRPLEGARAEGGPSPEAALRLDRHQGSRPVRFALRQRARRPGHREHHARQDPQGVPRPRDPRWPAAGRRDPEPGGPRQDRGRRRRPAPGRGGPPGGGAQKFDDSWKALLADIESKTTAMS